jgi:hypothetical protein
VFTISIVKERIPSRLEEENPKFEALNPKQYQMTKIQRTKRFLPLEHADFTSLPNNSPLKIRGARGVMKQSPNLLDSLLYHCGACPERSDGTGRSNLLGGVGLLRSHV